MPKSTQSKRLAFAIRGVITYCVTMAGGLWFSHEAARLAYPPAEDTVRSHFLQGLPRQLVRKDILWPGETRKAQVFWVGRLDYRGAGFDLLKSPSLFAEAYPGYSSARHDAALWKTYFSRDAEARGVWIPGLNQKGAERLLSFSAEGCHDIYKGYGADVVLFGSSQVYRTVIFSYLHQSLVGVGPLQDPKILNCSFNSMTPRGVRHLAKKLDSTGKRTPVAVFGYSLWNALDKSDSDDLADFSAEKKGLAALFPPLSWDSVSPLTYKRMNAGYADRLTQLPERAPENDETITNAEAGFYFSNRLARDPDKIRELSLKAKLFTRYLAGRDGSDCDLGFAEAELDRTLAGLLRLADRVVLFVGPTTDFIRSQIAPCIVAGIEQLIQARASDRVLVVPSLLKNVPLDYADFTYRFSGEGHAFLDALHLNFEGASRATHYLSPYIRDAMKRNDPKLAMRHP